MEIPPPPNGGLNAWLQILGAHLLFFNSWGIVLSYGAFQSYYQDVLLKSRSASEIAWIGTLQGFLLFLVGLFSGPLFDKGFAKTLTLVGSFLVVLGVMMTSISDQYYQVFLSQGVCLGLGAGCLFLPCVAIAATYFSTKRAFATGLVAAGGSLGGVIYPIVFQQLLPQVGFAWATRVIGFIALTTLLVPIAILKPRLPPPSKSRPLFDSRAWKNLEFDVFSIGLFLAFAGLYLPFFYVPAFVQSHVHASKDIGFYLVSVLNAASIFGRILPGLLADRVGSLNLLVLATIASGVLGFGWIGVDNVAGTIIFCILYGFFSGAVVTLPATVIAATVPDLNLVGTWVGMSFILAGLGLLIGNPIAGQILDAGKDQWVGGQVFGATLTLAGGLLFLLIRLRRATASRSWRM